METPPDSLGPFVADPVGGAEEPVPRPADPETLRFLRRSLLPSLRRAGRTTLVRPVERAVASGRVDGLARLPQRTRRELLEYLESGIPLSQRSPRALVALTSVVAELPARPAGTGRRLASPAR